MYRVTEGRKMGKQNKTIANTWDYPEVEKKFVDKKRNTYCSLVLKEECETALGIQVIMNDIPEKNKFLWLGSTEHK